nr:MAG TPA: hypothetical protein [Bacteriophage sp.]
MGSRREVDETRKPPRDLLLVAFFILPTDFIRVIIYLSKVREKRENMDVSKVDKFWYDRVADTIETVENIYKRKIKVDWNYKDGLAKVYIDDQFVLVCQDRPEEVMLVVDTIYAMCCVERNNQIDRLMDQFHDIVGK